MKCYKCGREAQPGDSMACDKIGGALFCLPSCELAAARGLERAVPNGDRHHGELTKREHFAGLAMQGIVSHPEMAPSTEVGIAEQAVAIADALLAELAAKEYDLHAREI